MLRQLLSDAPLWRSAFRPLYLLGVLYAPLLALGSGTAWLGVLEVAPADAGLLLWHGHEMVFGFAGAIVAGTLLTALPSWAGIAELQGVRLAVLTATWVAGRVGLWSSPWLPAPLVAALDLILWPLLLAWLARPLWRARQWLYRLALPIVAALALANGVYHAAMLTGDLAIAALALRAAVWTLVVLYVLVGGVLTPVFTGNALRELGRGDVAPAAWSLEATAFLAILALAVADLLGAPSTWIAAVALAALVLQAWRVARWRGWRVADQPLLLAKHLGFAWLLAALALRAAAALGAPLPPHSWLHAFTVGALGMMMIGLMVRVALRHTGRAPRPPALMRLGAAAVFIAALLRVTAGIYGLGTTAYAVSAALWAAAFAAYLLCFGRMLIAPSLPRETVTFR